jgi:chromosome segregation ATPase
LELSQGFKILNELESEGKITLEKCDLLKQRFYKMHKIMTDNQAKETQLQQRTKKIALELSSEVLKLEKAQQQQKEHEYKLKALEEKLDIAKKDTAQVDENNQGYQSEISKLENQKVERENEYAQAEQKKKDELNPIIDETTKEIA